MHTSVRVRELVNQFLADEPAGVGALWELVQFAALDPVLEILRQHGLDLALADEVIRLELYFHITKEDCRLLRAFAGSTEAELKGYLGTLAGSIAQNFVRDRRRALKREAKALANLPVSDQAGPSEAEMLAALKDF